MRSAGRLLIVSVVGALALAGGSSRSFAAERLVSGGFEGSSGPADWTATQSIVEDPGGFANATEHLDGADQDGGGLGVLIRPFAGNIGNYAGKNYRTNYTLSQTVAVGANRTFTLTGNSLVQSSSSVIVDELEGITPLGDYNLDTVVNAADYTIWRDTLGSTTDFRANGTNEGDSLDIIDEADYQWWKDRFGNAGVAPGTPSPTETFYKVEFLDVGNAVLATHSIDLRDDVTVDAWRTQTLPGLVSPAGTTQARVSLEMTNGVASCSTCAGGSDLLIDNISLNQTSTPFAGEKLTNGNLNTLGAPAGWVIEKTPDDNLSFAGSPSFAANTGNVGMWLRSWNGGDAKVLQTIAATPGAEYDFSAFSKWESGYIDLDPFHPETETFMTIEYLDASSTLIGSPITLLLDTVQQGDGMWRQFTVDGGVAPANTAFVRVSAGAKGMGNSTFDPQSAFFDDFSLNEILPGAGALDSGAVPEPGTFALVGLACACMLGIRRRGN